MHKMSTEMNLFCLLCYVCDEIYKSLEISIVFTLRLSELQIMCILHSIEHNVFFL